jgi:polysaccharide export outer membrane protein
MSGRESRIEIVDEVAERVVTDDAADWVVEHAPISGRGRSWPLLFPMLVAAFLAACGSGLPPAPLVASDEPVVPPEYEIAPLDSINVFVWQAPDLSLTVPVRPDGRISLPLVEDVTAAGKTPTALARELEDRLKDFVQDPIVTIIVTGFGEPTDQTVRVVGEAQQPVAVPYRANMTLLDLMVAVGGLTEFAAGNRAVLVRGRGEEEQLYGLRLGDLLNRGDISANTPVLPGDIVIVPKSFL